MSMRSLLILTSVLAASSSAHAATGKPDFGSYVGSDTLMPKPQLPVTGANSFLALADVTSATHTTITMNVPADGEDASYPVNLAGASLYGAALTNCVVNDNGFVACNGSSTFFDNRPLPDNRFGGQVLIAPYWDDLSPVSGTSTIDVWTQAGSFVIVQWTNFALYSNAAARVTFRATFQLGAAANRGSVVFQYLQMTGAGADGSSATIGIQRAGVTGWNQYSYNTTGAVLTGTAGANLALQAILFGYDTDGDRLSDTFETAVGSDPTLHDTDGGGLDDGAELALGKDPTVAGDDGANTDTDGDGISDASEMFYGTDYTKADTDGDSSMTTSLKDGEEIYTRRTDPTRVDTDGDGATDSAEIDAGTDPLDPTSTPPIGAKNLNVLNQGQTAPRSTLDANGNIHVVTAASSNGSLFYYMLNPTGQTLIPQTAIRLPKLLAGTSNLRRPVIQSVGGKVFITYELEDGNSNGLLGFVRINPASAPQDGSPVPDYQIVEINVAVAPPVGSPRHHDMVADAHGVHVAFVASPSWGAGGSGKSLHGLTYLLLGTDGSIQRTETLPLPVKGPTGGLHRGSRARIAVGNDGTVYIVMFARTKPKWTGSLLVATIAGATVKSYSIPSPLMAFERGSIAVKGTQLYVFGPSGSGRNGGASISTLRFGIIDLANITTSPAPAGDFWRQQTIVDPQSLLVPVSATPVVSGGNNMVEASLTVLSNGAALGYFAHKNTDDVCVASFAPTGALTTKPICVAGGQNRRPNRGRTATSLDLLPLAGGAIGFVYGPNNSNLYLSKLLLSVFNIPASFTPVNAPPRITSTPPSSSVHVGQAYAYAAMGSDVETPNALTWKLQNAPATMTVSATGAVAWTPVAADLGAQTATLQLCDGGAPSRCVSQALAINVVNAGAPLISSTPPTTAVANVAWLYQIGATDPQGEALTYALVAPSTAPGNLTLSATGLMMWTPKVQDVGSLLMTVKVTDSSGLSDQQTFTVVVTAPLDVDPVFQSLPSSTAVVGTPYLYKAMAIDRGDAAATFTYSLTSTPSGNLAVAADGTLTWTPTDAEKGTKTISVLATSSSGRSVTQSFAVTVIASSKSGCAMAPSGTPMGVLPLLLLLVLAARLVRRRSA
ncbi:MAG: dystroglycan-type cadherin-like domain repeat protein [bacterium]|nr:dystroglycan-type cadherin-like domain repeat protein [bacterium]